MLRLLLVLAATSLLPGALALPATIDPQHPQSPNVGTHGMAGGPVSLLGRHYNLAPRQFLLAGTPVDGLQAATGKNARPGNLAGGGLAGDPLAPLNMLGSPTPNVRQPTSPKMAEAMTKRPQEHAWTPPRVERDEMPTPVVDDSEQEGVAIEKREVGDVNYLSNVGPVNVPAAPYSTYATLTPSPTATPSVDKGQTKTKSKSKSKSKGKEDKKKS